MKSTTPTPANIDGVTLPQRAVLVVNARSRRGREWYDQAHANLKESGLDLEGSYACSRPAEVFERIRAAVKKQVPLIIVGGGDGTLSSAAKEIVGGKSTLGVLPMGTGNAFARDLGIDSDAAKACEVLLTGKVRSVDLGEVNGRYFVNVASVGLTTLIASGLTDDAKKRLGRMVYAFAIARAVLATKPFQAKLTTDEGTQEHTTLQFVVSSGRFHAGPFPVTPDAQITDRRLNGYLLATNRKSVLLKYALHLWGGRQVNLPEVHSFTTKEGRLETGRAMRVTIDGEISEKTPLSFRIMPGVLPVVVPQGFEDGLRNSV